MTALYRTRVAWTGFPGAPGVSTFYGLVEGALVPNLETFFLSIQDTLPEDVIVTIEAYGDVIEDTTGELTGSWTATPVTPIGGTMATAYAAPVGYQYKWLTETVVDGHRLRGRTFIVPAGSGNFQTDGSVLDSRVVAAQADGDDFVALVTGDLVVWHRPRAARAADGSRPAVTSRAGSHGLVTACSVPDKAVVLRSRRD